MKLSLSRHPLVTTLTSLEGNPRASVYTEPLWGIPYNLFLPYVSVYMLALGVRDAQIGLVTSLGLLTQPIFALLSGPITDKYGRRLTTFVADLMAWSVPTLIWAFAQDIRYFVVAAIFNAMWRIPANSWTCLLVEDAEEGQLLHIWTWIYVAGLLSAFFAPLAGFLVGAIELIPAVRILYVLAFFMMTMKGWILYRNSTETRQGRVRMVETQGQSIFSLLDGYRPVLKQILHSPRTLVALGIMFVMSVVFLVHGTFWSILVTEKLNIPAEHLSIFAFVNSAILLVLYFLLVPRLDLQQFRNPMLLGFTGFLVSHLVLITMPEGNYGLLFLSVLIEAFSLAMFKPLMESLIVISIRPEERARINAIMSIVVIVLSSPFGWIAGQLSEINRTLPFILNISFFVLGTGLVALAWRLQDQEKIPSGLKSTLQTDLGD